MIAISVSLDWSKACLALGVAICLAGCFASTDPCSDGAGKCATRTEDSGAGAIDAAANFDAALEFDSPVTTCDPNQNMPVGSYVVETDYWNAASCPGTQCMTVDSETGAFIVTQGPACGSTVASYPNVLYGSSFGTVSPGSALPLPLSALTSVTSTWSFSVGGASTDRYDVAYDIWFCPDTNCGATGFNGGTEMMIWLDYQNTTGWKSDKGAVTLGGYDWEVWTSTQAMSGDSWTYLAYLIHPPMVTSVTDLDLLAFIEDAESRSLIQSSFYLYAVQAGDELRTGGLPFMTTSFSVSINGQ